MEGLIKKIDELKKEAERVKKTCRCEKNNEVQIQTPASKRTRRNSGAHENGNGSCSHSEPAPAKVHPSYAILFFLSLFLLQCVE